MESSQYEYRRDVRSRREDKHPVFTKIRNICIGISTVAAAATTLFLAFGFQFKTPASWLDENKQVTERAIIRINAVEDRVEKMEAVMVILARDACSRMTRQQLLVTPQCDQFTFPPRVP